MKLNYLQVAANFIPTLIVVLGFSFRVGGEVSTAQEKLKSHEERLDKIENKQDEIIRLLYRIDGKLEERHDK